MTYRLAPTPYNIYNTETGAFVAGIYHESNLQAELSYQRKQGCQVEVVDFDEHRRRFAASAKFASGLAPHVMLQCDMDHDCQENVTHIDDGGSIYCTHHGIRRRSWKRCRKMRMHEIRRLLRGEPLASY